MKYNKQYYIQYNDKGIMKIDKVMAAPVEIEIDVDYYKIKPELFIYKVGSYYKLFEANTGLPVTSFTRLNDMNDFIKNNIDRIVDAVNILQRSGKIEKFKHMIEEYENEF